MNEITQMNPIEVPTGTMKKVAPNLYFRQEMKGPGHENGSFILIYHPSDTVNVNEPLWTDNFEWACLRRDRRMIQIKARCKAVRTKNKNKSKRIIERELIKEFQLFGFTITITKL